jgi:two-component system, NarL family, sensor histidine kinase DesK
MTAAPKHFRDLGWETYAWLICSLPFLITSVAASIPAWMKAVLVGEYAAFLVLYFAGYFTRGPRILWIIAGLDALAVAGSAWNPSAASFFIFAAAFVAHGFPAPSAWWVLAAQVLVSGAASFALHAEWWFYAASMVISTLIGALTIQGAAKEAGDARLRLAQEEVERLAKLAERERIARDMHDLLGHTLSVVVLKSELAQKLMPRDPAKAMQEMAEVERISRQGLAEVREAITGYRSTGLAAEIEHVRATLAAAGIDTTIEARQIALAPAQESALTLALREAATNVIRHAQATRCHIRFYAQDGSALMEVQDDGRGSTAPFGNGLNGMRERIQALGGMLQRESDSGTRLLISIPL